MQTPKQKAVLYIDRNRLDIYIHGSDSVLSCTFSPSTISDLDVKNEDELNKIISLFISQNRLSPSFFMTVFSHNVLFEKEIPNIQDQQLQDTVLKFIENVPFENVVAKTFRLPNGYRVIATNKDFYELIKAVFEQNGFVADGAVADYSLGPEFSQLSQLDIVTAKSILQKFDSLKTQSLVSADTPKRVGSEPETAAQEPAERPKSMLPLLLPVLGILILILIILFITQFINRPPPMSSRAVQPAIVQPTVIPIASLSATPTIFPTFAPPATNSSSIQTVPQP